MGISPQKGLGRYSEFRPLEEDEEPPSLSKVATVMATPSPHRLHYSQPQDPSEEPASHHTMKPRALVETLGEGDIPMTPLDKDLKSPPNIVNTTKEYPWMNSSSPPATQTMPSRVAQVSPSPESQAQAPYPSSGDVPGDEMEAAAVPMALRPMVSPDGKLEFKRGLEQTPERETETESGKEGHHRRSKTSSSIEGGPQTLSPFHPQGAVGIESAPLGKDLTVSHSAESLPDHAAMERRRRSLSLPVDMQVSALEELTTTL